MEDLEFKILLIIITSIACNFFTFIYFYILVCITMPSYKDFIMVHECQFHPFITWAKMPISRN